MTELIVGDKTEVAAVIGAMRALGPCGLITPETRMQAGLRREGQGRLRVFFGDQTDPTSMELIKKLAAMADGSPIEVELEGYFKVVQNWPDRPPLLDDGALFVRRVDLIV